MGSFSALHVSFILNCLFMKVGLSVFENSRVTLQVGTETLEGLVTKARHGIVYPDDKKSADPITSLQSGQAKAGKPLTLSDR